MKLVISIQNYLIARFLNESRKKIMLNSVKALLVVGILAILTSFRTWQEDSIPSSNRTRIRTVCLDAGHGGKDPGCIGATGIHESKIALRVILELGKKLEAEYPNLKVIYTRKKDVFIDLHERSAIANRNKADLFISVHCNSHPSSKFFGTETYTMGLHKTEGNLDVAKRENSVILQETDYKRKYKGFDPNSPLAHIMMANFQNAFMANSIKFAQKVERQFKKTSDRKSYGVKQAGFLVLWETAMPSVLVEAGFLTNRDEEKYLNTENGQEEVAEAIAKAFRQYKEEIEN